jgi:hypothetical protein
MTARMNEFDFPHLVELPLPPGGLGEGILRLQRSIKSVELFPGSASLGASSASHCVSLMPRTPMLFSVGSAERADRFHEF